MLSDLLQNFQRKIEKDDETLLEEVENLKEPVKDFDEHITNVGFSTENFDKFMQNTFSGFRVQPQSENETQQYMKLFNEKDDSEPLT